jgi:hypothetical protein
MLSAPALEPTLQPSNPHDACLLRTRKPLRAQVAKPRAASARPRRATRKTPFLPPREFFTRVFPTFPFSGMWEIRSSPLQKHAGITRPIPHIRFQGNPAILGESARQPPVASRARGAREGGGNRFPPRSAIRLRQARNKPASGEGTIHTRRFGATRARFTIGVCRVRGDRQGAQPCRTGMG